MNPSEYTALSAAQKATLTELRRESGGHKVGTPRPRNVKYDGLSTAVLPITQDGRRMPGATLIATRIRKRDRSMEVLTVDRDGSYSTQRYSRPRRGPGRSFAIALEPHDFRIGGARARTLFQGLEFSTLKAAQALVSAWGLPATHIAEIEETLAGRIPGLGVATERTTVRRFGVDGVEVAA